MGDITTTSSPLKVRARAAELTQEVCEQVPRAGKRWAAQGCLRRAVARVAAQQEVACVLRVLDGCGQVWGSGSHDPARGARGGRHHHVLGRRP